MLLTIASLGDEAYSVSICDELTNTTKRSVKLGVVHAVLNRLEEKGLLKSKIGEATKVRGGKRKRYYHITSAGKSVLVRSKEWRDELWSRIPDFVLKTTT